MKRAWILVLLVALMVAIVLPFNAAFGQDSTPAFQQGTVTSRSGEIAVRAEPDLSSETLGTLANDTVVDVLEVGAQWTHIRTDDLDGYVFTSNLAISLKFLNLSATTSTNSDLAVRAEPNISAETVDVVPNGSTVGVIFVDGLWAYIYTGDAVGWTFTRELVLAADGTAAAEFLTDQATAATRNELAVRAEPSINSDLAFTVNTGEHVNVLYSSENGLFSYILYDGQLGWALVSDLTVDSPRALATGVVNELRVNFRSEASSESADTIITQLPTGAEVLIIGRTEDGNWLHVRYEGQSGWVSTEFIGTDVDVTTLPVTG